MTPQSAPCKAVLAKGFADCRDAAPDGDKGPTFHNFDPQNFKGEVIDYVFVKGDVTVNKFEVIRDVVDGDLPSDHYPVYADVTF